MKCDFHHCRSCEFIFKDPKDYVSQKSERKQYEQHNNSFENSGYVEMFRDFIGRCVTPYKSNIETVIFEEGYIKKQDVLNFKKAE